MFKVDFEKAYDSVSWGFLEYMLGRMGFNEKWVAWMKACIFNGSVSVLVNGSPTSEFSMGRGLRQGDPLAPFLFLIVAEGLNGLIRKSIENRYFEELSIGEGVSFPILQFVDGTLIMCKKSKENLWCLKAVLRVFEMASGLRVNFHKSCLIGLNIEQEEQNAAAQFLYCKVGEYHLTSLGFWWELIREEGLHGIRS